MNIVLKCTKCICSSCVSHSICEARHCNKCKQYKLLENSLCVKYISIDISEEDKKDGYFKRQN